MSQDAAPLALDLRENRGLVPLGALLLGAVGMGASTIFVRFADVGPQASAFWRVALALPFLWAWTAAESRGLPAPRLGRAAVTAVVLSGVFFAGDLFFWHLAILNTTIANATFLATTSPLLVIFAAAFLFRERIRAPTLAGLLLCLLGGGALLGSSYSHAPERIFGDLCGLATACFFGAYMLAVAKARTSVGTARLSFLSAGVTAALLLVLALATGERLWPGSPEGALVLLGLALVSQIGGQGLLAFALGHLPAGFSSLVIFFEALAAAALAWALLGETLGAPQAVGGVMILAGIVIARPKQPPRHPA